MEPKNNWMKEWQQSRSRGNYSQGLIGLVGMVLTCIALWDLSHRPAEQVKGKKWAWAIVSFLQPFGPAIYLLFGRKREAAV
jgi:hypothetical protein